MALFPELGWDSASRTRTELARGIRGASPGRTSPGRAAPRGILRAAASALSWSVPCRRSTRYSLAWTGVSLSTARCSAGDSSNGAGAALVTVFLAAFLRAVATSLAKRPPRRSSTSGPVTSGAAVPGAAAFLTGTWAGPMRPASMESARSLVALSSPRDRMCRAPVVRPRRP